MNHKFYITTTLPYVNSDPHIGFALEIITADTIARYQRLQGKEVIFNTGTDEHGLKIYQKALEQNQNPQAYVDYYAAKFKELIPLLNLSVTNFIRTTDPHHLAAAQEFWKRCETNGDIYKQKYEVKYCIGCELEKTDSELIDGKCPLHPNQELELIEEENYFFRFSRYQQPLLDYYQANPDFVRPEEKFREIKSFVAQGLKDFSISRLKEKMPWGVEVPGDPDQVMYVWFDALINYISTLGWPKDESTFKQFWPGTQIAGKDNLRQQSAMWQAMLLSAKLPPSQQILINGFISVDGQKMSKSLGNAIEPKAMVEKFGAEATRYLLLSLGPISGDMDVSWEKFVVRYNANLANGLGNLIARIATLAEKSGFHFGYDEAPGFRAEVKTALEAYRFDQALEEIWKRVTEVNLYIEAKRPWELEGKELQAVLQTLVAHLRQIGFELQPFMPQTAAAITQQFKGPKIKKETSLFPRII